MACTCTIFREYILKRDNFPTDIINPYIQNFDFILGFAKEKETGKGKFVPTWNPDAGLSPQSVNELKRSYPNVRVVISIGGVGSEFNPIVPNIDWVTTAVSSIEDIINHYRIDGIAGIDGIDIHYDVINNIDQFATVIGDVIQRLRNNRAIKVVSIAPNQNVQDHYRALYFYNSNNIDLVDYRFYNQRIPSVGEFIDAYYSVVAAYSAGKVLAGIGIPHDPRIFGGIIYLIQNNLMPGLFVWNADKSRQYV